jgi:hypothetical protein
LGLLLLAGLSDEVQPQVGEQALVVARLLSLRVGEDLLDENGSDIDG